MATILCECGAVCLEILGTSMMSVVCHLYELPHRREGV